MCVHDCSVYVPSTQSVPTPGRSEYVLWISITPHQYRRFDDTIAWTTSVAYSLHIEILFIFTFFVVKNLFSCFNWSVSKVVVGSKYHRTVVVWNISIVFWSSVGLLFCKSLFTFVSLFLLNEFDFAWAEKSDTFVFIHHWLDSIVCRSVHTQYMLNGMWWIAKIGRK